MKIILISSKHKGARSIELSRWSRALLSLCCLGLPLGLAASGYLVGQQSGPRLSEAAPDTLRGASPESVASEGLSEPQLRAMTGNLAELEARMTRLDALGQHLTAVADLQEGEFNFSGPPAVGGPMVGDVMIEAPATSLTRELSRLAVHISDREQQLSMLETLLSNRKLQEQELLSGMPVKGGYMSSRYGWRADPITGKRSMHRGLDFAGKTGSDIVAVASGVVSWAGRNAGYGNMVEISHGNDLVTRYAHNKENLVVAGDVVRKGDTIALMGSSGRVTGPHVHFEVYKNGRAVDPSSYVARTQP
ncbi:MAG: M23 family metallopeptidase [Halioglobus sp.]|nr:M23 family metallopeptidase [Halioglobus sp.]